MNSSKSALLAAIIGTAVLMLAFGLIFAFVPGHKKFAISTAEGNSANVAALDIKVKNPNPRQCCAPKARGLAAIIALCDQQGTSNRNS